VFASSCLVKSKVLLLREVKDAPSPKSPMLHGFLWTRFKSNNVFADTPAGNLISKLIVQSGTRLRRRKGGLSPPMTETSFLNFAMEKPIETSPVRSCKSSSTQRLSTDHCPPALFRSVPRHSDWRSTQPCPQPSCIPSRKIRPIAVSLARRSV